MGKGVIICLTVWLVIFGSLSLTFFLLGCDPTLQPNCLRYTIREALITNYIIEQETCNYCTSWSESCSTSTNSEGEQEESCTSSCDEWIPYTCYDSFAVATFEVDHQNKTCNVKVANDQNDRDEALEKAKNKYSLYNKYDIYVHKKNFSCKSISSLRGFAIAGLVFACLSGSVLLCLLYACRKTSWWRCKCRRRTFSFPKISNPPPWKIIVIKNTYLTVECGLLFICLISHKPRKAILRNNSWWVSYY